MAKKTNINKCSYINEEKDLFLYCECNSEILVLSPNIEDKEIYCSIYRYRYLKPGLKHRLHHCWHILKTGSPYEDEIILSKKDAKQLKDYLEKCLKKMDV